MSPALQAVPWVAGCGSARPAPDHQPPVSHFPSNDISQAAASVAMLFHQEKPTLPSLGWLYLGGGKPAGGEGGRCTLKSRFPLRPAAVLLYICPALPALGGVTRKGVFQWWPKEEGHLFLSTGARKDGPQEVQGKGNSEKALPR